MFRLKINNLNRNIIVGLDDSAELVPRGDFGYVRIFEKKGGVNSELYCSLL